MRIAVVQTNPVFGDTDGNIASAIDLMKSVQADLYVLPELFATGYNFATADEVIRLAEPANGKTFAAIAKYCEGNSCHVAYGFAEQDGNLYNSAALVGPRGLLGLYRKVHLFFRENLFFTPGNLGFPVFDLPFGRVGMMICFDWIYPEAARTLAHRGARIIIHPSNLVMSYCPDAMITRCLENRVFAATANRVGEENRGGVDLRYTGTSQIVSPGGAILLRLTSGECGASVIGIDPAEADGKRLNQFNDLFHGRRPDQYCLQ